MRSNKLKVIFVVVGLALTSVMSVMPSTVAAASLSSAGNLAVADTPNVLVKPVQGPSVTQRLETRAKQSWPWYITRAAGFVAAISLVLLMLSGIGFITGKTFRLLEPLTAWATHKAVGYVFGVSVVVHVVALLFDKYTPFTIAEVLLPFVSHYQEATIAGYHVGSLAVALGVFALYFMLAIIISSILWIDKKPHTWKLFHFLAYLTMIFVFFHALYLGTDLIHGALRIIWVIFGLAVGVAIVYRLRRRG